MHVCIDDVDECNETLHDIIAAGIHAIKINGDVIKRYVEDGLDKETIRCVKRHADRYGVDVIAEHIEDAIALQAVQALEIDYGQGFFLIRPSSTVKRTSITAFPSASKVDQIARTCVQIVSLAFA